MYSLVLIKTTERRWKAEKGKGSAELLVADLIGFSRGSLAFSLHQSITSTTRPPHSRSNWNSKAQVARPIHHTTHNPNLVTLGAFLKRLPAHLPSDPRGFCSPVATFCVTLWKRRTRIKNIVLKKHSKKRDAPVLWCKQNLFVHRNHKLNKQQGQETQKRYAYLSVTPCSFLPQFYGAPFYRSALHGNSRKGIAQQLPITQVPSANQNVANKVFRAKSQNSDRHTVCHTS